MSLSPLKQPGAAPYLVIEGWPDQVDLEDEVTTVGRGSGCDIALDDPTVSRLHAELVRRGPHLYVSDLSRNGTTVNGRPVGRRVLGDGDVIGFGQTRARVGGIPFEDVDADTAPLDLVGTPAVTRREGEVLTVLCRPAAAHQPFIDPPSAREIADELGVTDAAVKQHLMRLYRKFQVEEGPNRRGRLANLVIASGVVRPIATDWKRSAQGR